MNSIIEKIYNFQKIAGLADKEYDDFLENSFQIEEALEGFDVETLGKYLFLEKDKRKAKEISRHILLIANAKKRKLEDVDRLDKACDAIIFAIGSMAKLNLTPDQIIEALEAVNESNMQKINMPKDEYGKLLKPKDFKGPEPKLREILKKRKK